MAGTPPTESGGPLEDSLYRHSLREAIFILSVWASCLVYTVTYCYLNGFAVHESPAGATGPSVAGLVGSLEAYDRDAASLTTPLGLGIPDWVFYGIVIPWLLCIAVTVVFCTFFFAEDDLGEVGREPAAREASDG